MRYFITVVILLFTGSFAFAQQDPQFSMNMFTHMAINPAYAGAKESICVTALARQQWMGFQDPSGDNTNPRSNFFSIDAEIERFRSGIGLVIVQDKIAFETSTSVKLAYAYRAHLGPGKLGIGAQINFMEKAIDFSKFIPKDPNDPLLMAKGVESDMLMDFSAGLFYNTPEYFAGISATQLSQAEFESPQSIANPALKRHYYIIGGYNYQFSPILDILPSVLIKTDFVSTQYDINARVLYNNMVWGGLTYRTQDAVVVMAGTKFLRTGEFGVAYDITTSRLGRSGRSHGSVELFLRYCFNIVIPHHPQGHRDVRRL